MMEPGEQFPGVGLAHLSTTEPHAQVEDMMRRAIVPWPRRDLDPDRRRPLRPALRQRRPMVPSPITGNCGEQRGMESSSTAQRR